MDVLPCWAMTRQGVVAAVPVCASKSYICQKSIAGGCVRAGGEGNEGRLRADAEGKGSAPSTPPLHRRLLKWAMPAHAHLVTPESSSSGQQHHQAQVRCPLHPRPRPRSSRARTPTMLSHCPRAQLGIAVCKQYADAVFHSLQVAPSSSEPLHCTCRDVTA